MDLLILFYSILLTWFLICKDVHSIQVASSVSPQTPVLGDNVFRLQCTFTLTANNPVEQLLGLTLMRKKSTDQDFQNILVFNPPSLNVAPSYIDTSLETRTTVKWPDTSLSTSATLTFNNTLCSDIADYKWEYTYFQSPAGTLQDSSTNVVDVKVAGMFTGQSDYGISFSPAGYDVTEGDNITFTCKADIGRTPQGNLAWYYYYDGNSQAQPISDQASKDGPEVARTCSQSQRSVLVMTMRPDLNKYLVRCTLQQDDSTPDGDDHRQTDKFNVKYSPRNTDVNSNPAGLVHTEGQESLTLMCVAQGNPDPTYSWLLPNGTEVDGQTLQMSNLQLNDTGNYTCHAKNGIPDANFTEAKQVTISVGRFNTVFGDLNQYRIVLPLFGAAYAAPNKEKATTTQSTTPSSTPVTTPGGPTSQATTGDDGDDDKTVIIIVVCVVAGVLIIVAIAVVCICKRKKKPEIEEPPEKPRNNQDLTFYGNRPGLTTSNDSLQKSGNNLNTSFNSFDSADSKPRNDDGLMYVDLQFDNKPGSRRPIQLYDNNSSTQYADIAMPRV